MPKDKRTKVKKEDTAKDVCQDDVDDDIVGYGETYARRTQRNQVSK